MMLEYQRGSVFLQGKRRKQWYGQVPHVPSRSGHGCIGHQTTHQADRSEVAS